MLRSILSVVLGYLTMAGLVIATVFVVFGSAEGWEENQVPSTGSLVLFAVLGGVYALLGGWVTARVAPRAPFVHVLALGAVILGLWFLDAGASPMEVPTWFQVAILFSGVFGALVGGGLGAAQARRRSAT